MSGRQIQDLIEKRWNELSADQKFVFEKQNEFQVD